jgi:hypothetical protein
MIGIANELSIFVSACLSGNLICLSYYVLRVIRRLVKHSLVWVSIEDLVFWVGAAIYLFMEMYRTCSGSIRWYFVLGVLAGGIATIYLVKKIVDKTEKTE